MAIATPNYDRLTWRAKRFVDCLVDLEGPGRGKGRGADAMREIGFTGKRPKQAAWKLMQRPGVRAAIDERRALVAQRAGLSADKVINTILETMDRCRQAEPVHDRSGNPVLIENAEGKLVPAYVFDAKGVLKGAELLGGYLKMFTQKHEHTGPGGGPIQTQHVDELTDAQLEVIARTGRAAPVEPEEGED